MSQLVEERKFFLSEIVIVSDDNLHISPPTHARRRGYSSNVFANLDVGLAVACVIVKCLVCFPYAYFCFPRWFGSPRTGSTIRMKRSLPSVADQLPEPFIADHSFMWLLRDNDTGTWIFLGRLVEPRFVSADAEITPVRHNDEL